MTRGLPLRLVSGLGLLLLAALLVGPVISVALASLMRAEAPLSMPPALWLHSAVIAAVAVTVAVAVGMTIALWAAHVRTPSLRALITLAGAFPLVIPMYVHGMAMWQVSVRLGLYRELADEGPWSDLLVVGFVQGLRLSAFVHLITLAGWHSLHARWLEAGLLVGPRGFVRRRLLGPLLAPFVALAALLVAVISVTDVSIPLLFQVRSVIAMRLWWAHYAGLDPIGAWGAMVAPSLLVLAAVALITPPLWRRAAPLLSARRDPAEIPRGEGGQWLFALGGVIAVVLANGALIHLFVQITSLSLLAETFRANTGLISATVTTALGAAAVAMFAGGALALFLGDRGWRTVPPLLIALVFFTVPGFLWAVAAVSWWSAPGLRGDLYETGTVRWLVLGGRLLVIPAVILALAHARQSRTQREAALGLGWWHRWWGVVWPPLRRAAWVAYALVALMVIGDLDAAILMDLPGHTTLVVGLCNRLHISPRSPEVAMMAAVILATSLAMLALPAIVSGGWRRWREIR
ncbi:hypothetical protein JXA47_09015 [Candidatus Sumerlaeota bacterium]|nr:hypothetical protein [Candidatus Sumerlaeota bacterium]